ncbi:interleukin-18-like [Leptodactylus fuscus]|uniref:interleukin-18-like n=1 Tax=Leptodactylus fuscus TaxID=238119 RepID=UPI003F4ED83B
MGQDFVTMSRRNTCPDYSLMKKMCYDKVDGFKTSFDSPLAGQLKNQCGLFLTVNPVKRIAIFTPESDTEILKKTTFYLQLYRSSANIVSQLPVAISCKVGKKEYFLKVEKKEVVVVEGSLPKEIMGQTSELIFYMHEFHYEHKNHRFESSLNQGLCLAWSQENGEKKLILKQLKLSKDEAIDETTKFIFLENDGNS